MPAGMRADVADSWRRSAAAGVDVDAEEPTLTLPADDVRDLREAHPLAAVYPMLEQVLGGPARASESVLAVSDEHGQLLWVTGSTSTLRRAEAIGFMEGANWAEPLAGTNAPGTALVLDRAMVIRGTEHFRESVRPWSCVAAPVHDPGTGRILGVLDITGGPEAAAPQVLGLVRAAARLAEAHLALGVAARAFTGSVASALAAPPGPEIHRRGQVGGVPDALDVPFLRALGRREAVLAPAVLAGDAVSGRDAVRLSLRHSELLVLLSAAPAGLRGEELAVLLYPEDVNDSTLRAEVNRLRGALGPDVVESRPYRLLVELASDWQQVRADLARGDVVAAVRGYHGPLLPASQAPGIVELRSDLHQEIRAAVLASGRSDLLADWTHSPWGADDLEAWSTQRRLLVPGSPLRPLIDAQVRRLDADLGGGPIEHADRR